MEFSSSSKIMSKTNVRRYAMDDITTYQESKKLNQIFFQKHLKRVYPIGSEKSFSSSSSSSLSSSLSQNSNDSCFTDSLNLADENVSLPHHLISPHQRRERTVVNTSQKQQNLHVTELGKLKRCNWITKNCGININLLSFFIPLSSPLHHNSILEKLIMRYCSDKAYIEFHDECWGVPAYDDKKLLELLAMAGLLIDYNWTEILKRKEVLRQVFAGFDPNIVAKMEEKEIMEIASNKELLLADSRVKCIIDNAKCIIKIIREYGSFSSYIWSYVNHKPVINRLRYSRDVPLRTPKAEAISKDLIKRGFRFMGPVIVNSFMQAAGLTIDHLVDCYRHKECVNLAERPWKHI